jgi:steroid delta-isomerase
MAADDHPARVAGLESQKFVSQKNRAAWLELFAEDGFLADPVGASPLDPDGKGHPGKNAIAAFYDNVISKVDVSFDYPRSYACANQCAFIGTVYVKAPDQPEAGSEGVFLYTVNDAGKILSLQAYWEFERPQPGGDHHPPVGRER